MTLNNHLHNKNKTSWITLFSLLLFFSLSIPQAFGAATTVDKGEDRCPEVIEMLKAQKSEMSKELRHIKREIAVLKATMEKPGITEIVGGIGYILGLFGIGYYIYARSKLKAKV